MKLFVPRTLAALVAFALALALAGAFDSRAAEGKKDKKPKSAEEGLFSETRVLQLKIEISTPSLELLHINPKDYVRATLHDGDQILNAVGIRYRGGSTADTIPRRPNFTLKFNEFAPEQSFHGQNKILLDTCAEDPTFLTQLLANDLFRAAGVPATRCAYARVELNGRDLGLYLLSEGVNRDFLGRHFDKTKGNLYEGTHRDIDGKLDKDSGDDKREQPDVDALAGAAREADPTLRLSRIDKVLDLDEFLSFAALEVLTGHQGGYTLGTNKFRLYHDPATDKMYLFPHGIDRAFAQIDAPILPEWRGLLARAIIGTPQGRAKYLERVTRLQNALFKPEAMLARVTEIAARIRPIIAQQDSSAGQGFDQAVAQLKENIQKRCAFVAQQLKRLSS